MRYTVRSPEGELKFQSFGELERAFWSGLVDSEDEVQEEGTTAWRKASSFAVLRRERPLTGHDRMAQNLWLALGVMLGSVGLWGLTARSLGDKRYGIVLLAAIGLALVLGRLARGASTRKPTRR